MQAARSVKRILFVMPLSQSEFGAAREALAGTRKDWNLFVPLSFATLAALTPKGFTVSIWDEALHGPIQSQTGLAEKYDLLGVTGYQHDLRRAIAIAEFSHQQGIPIVIGGPGVTGSPEVCRGKFDVLFLGEAELTWPRFLNDWEQGNYRSEYRQIDRVDMSISPLPDWQSVAKDIPKYLLGSVQTTRGCPYDCEFCDVIHLFGRKPRHKPVEHVIQEIVNLERLGVARIFVCDDDFIGDFKYAKQLLQALIPVNNSFKRPIAFQTQADISCARDEELLALMADCNFQLLHIGIETPRASSLKETHKLQNLRVDLLDACRKIQSFGISVWALMIVGFDADDTDIFEEQFRFIEDANIVSMNINILKAYRGTPLWVRLQQENRVVDVSDIEAETTKAITNIMPQQMTRTELLEGYWSLLSRVRSWDSLEKRALGFLSQVQRKPRVKKPALHRRLWTFGGFVLQRVMRRGKVAPELRALRKRLVRETLRTAPYMLERVMFVAMHEAGEIMAHQLQWPPIQQQLEMEKKGATRLERDPSAGKIPPDFRRKLLDVLPSIYDRLSERITEKPAIPVAMLGVVKDFIIRWGDDFKGFEPHHQTYLSELCDRHVERWQINEPANAVPPTHAMSKPVTREQLINPQFIQALMAVVEQELRSDANAQVAHA
jgi:radical SAM superfamily enzyme YgiQ (UPF0313 family)